MAIALTNSASNSAASGSSLTVTFGFTATSGRLLVAFGGCKAASAPAILSGWTLINNYSGGTVAYSFYYKISDGTETAVTFSGMSNQQAAGVMQFSGNDATPLDQSGQGSNGTSTTQTATASAVNSQSDVVSVFGLSGGSYGVGSISGYTITLNATPSSNTVFLMAYKIESSTITSTATNDSSPYSIASRQTIASFKGAAVAGKVRLDPLVTRQAVRHASVR